MDTTPSNPFLLPNAGASYTSGGLFPGFAYNATATQSSGYTSIGPPFSADATPTSGWFSSGLFGSGIGPAGSQNYLPPPDITGYTYGDYATPNYLNPPAAAVPQPSTLYNTTNPQAPNPSTPPRTYILIGGALAGLILLGYIFDKHGHRKPRKKK